MVTAFQPNAFQNNAFQITNLPVTVGDFVDYIFQFPDQGSFLRDPRIQAAAPSVGAVQLLIYNPVETIQSPVPVTGNSLVFPPQLANSSVALPGFWGMVTLKSATAMANTTLSDHPNIQIVNNRTLMFAQKPSVLLSKIDVSHINIVINIFGVYVRDGLQLVVSGAQPFSIMDFGIPILVSRGGTE